MKLKSFLKLKKISLQEFSRQSGVKYSTLYKIFHYETTPNLQTAALIKKATNDKVKFEDWLK
jgi:predicted transcriptional regulator